MELTNPSGSPPKMSLLAQFDDMCRFADSMFSINSVDEQSLIDLLTKSEANRKQWLSLRRELTKLRTKFEESENKNKDLEYQQSSIRTEFATAVRKREELKKRKKCLINQLNGIKDMILTEDTIVSHSEETKQKALSFVELEQIELDQTNESIEGLEYDHSEDSIDISSTKRTSRGFSMKNLNLNIDLNESVASDQNTVQKNFTPNGIHEITEPSTPEIKYVESLDLVNMSTGHLPAHHLLALNESTIENLSQYLHPFSVLRERKHSLRQKKAFKPINCNPCQKPIGFLNNYLFCDDCKAVCHISCKDKLQMPCIPFRKPNDKGFQMVLIADFAPQTRPMIPALIFHCCNEIETRGLQEEGIYRKCGSDKVVRELKDKILKSKTGIPLLVEYEIHVLCGVVKQFLRELDEPIVTRVLWRDFVRASDQESPEQEKALIMKTVEELPTANRDSLAFLMVHLIRVSQSEGNQMDCKSLSQIFGPTIVGHLLVDPQIADILNEIPKQIKVMEAFFRVPEEFWSNLLITTNCWEINQSNSPFGRRLTSGQLTPNSQRGSLTPNRSPHSKRSLTLKPLF